MKCPLLYIKPVKWEDLKGAMVYDCLKEECAWWDQEMQQCSINGLEPTLQHIALSLRDLVEKMPLRSRG